MDDRADPPAEVRAAGGVVWREGPDAQREVLLIHRPRYDDWTLPKGKADPGERDEDCARREVTEETGMTCVLGPELRTVRYSDHKGRPKVVRYWAMTSAVEPAPQFFVNDEVDRVRWVRASEVRPLLTYDHDRQVIDSFDDALRQS